MAPLLLGVFGAFQVTLANGSTAKFESDRTRALLAYLAVEADRPHRRDAIAGLFWPDESERVARHNLRQALYSLRQTIRDASAHPPYLHISNEEIQFNTRSQFVLDLASFSSLLAATASHAHSRLDMCAICAPRLQQAVDLYRGRFLQEFFLGDTAEFEEWALARREGLHQQALDALGDLANYYEQHGDPGAARRTALRQLELDPWREQGHRQLMRVLALEGEYGAAIAQYETCKRVLAQELGIEPSSETRELYEQIRAGNWLPGVTRQIPSPPPTPLSHSSNLPSHLTPFVGRERELSDLVRLIADPACRWITLVGPGGIGKTRLAVQAALDHRNPLVEGAIFVALAAIESLEAVAPAIADALGFAFFGPTNHRVQLLNYLRDKQLLLVVDNVEQLLSAADLFIEILEHTTEIKLLLTSREALNVQGEWIVEVEGLEIPEEDRGEAIHSSAAAALFLQRAQRARAGFALTEQEGVALARLCRLVEGSPLALELAATWVRTLTVSEIVREIERDWSFLGATVRDLPARHRSMRIVFDQSWKMLDSEERRALRELSILRGRFQRQAAEQVTGASLATLSALVAKSLVRRTASGHYDLHELVRQFAASELGDSMDDVAERHSRYYLDWLGRSISGLQGRRQGETVAELVAEIDNIRAAWDWAAAHSEIAEVSQASPALWYLFELQAWFEEGETIFRKTAEKFASQAAETTTGSDSLTAANAMRAHAAYFAFRLGNSSAAFAALLPCVANLRSSADQLARIYAPWYLGLVSWHLGKIEEAEEHLKGSLERARTGGARWYEAMIGQFIGIVAANKGEYDLSYQYLAESLENARRIGDPTLIAHILSYIGPAALQLGRGIEAKTFLSESLAITREIGYRHGIGNALDGLGLVAQATSPQEASALFSESCAMYRDIQDYQSLSRALTHLGYSSLALGEAIEAQNAFVEVLRLSRKGGYLPYLVDAMAGLATLWANSSNDERALELAYHVLQHPAATVETKSRAETLRVTIESRLTPQQLQTVQARAKQQSFNEIIEQAENQLV